MDMRLYFQSVIQAMLQIFLLGLLGFVLVRRKALSNEGVSALTNFFINVVFPALIFWQIVTKFKFESYPNWWMFPLASFGVTVLGLLVGCVFSFSAKDIQAKREFICLSGFQNSGYLPLVLLGWIVPKERLSTMLIYLFLFLLGFNLVIWSWGVYFLSVRKAKRFSWGSLLSPPVAAILTGFGFVAFKINTLIPPFIFSSLESLGNCSFPLAIVVVGAILAEFYSLQRIDKKTIAVLIFAKLFVLPLLGLLFLSCVKLPYLIGLLIILELSVPSGINLAIISRKYSQQERLIGQGIFFTHIISLVTLPLFLSAFNLIVMRQ